MAERPSPERLAEIRDDNGTRGPEGEAIKELFAEIDALKAELEEYHRRDAEDADTAASFDVAEAEADRKEAERIDRVDAEYARDLYLASLRPER